MLNALSCALNALSLIVTVYKAKENALYCRLYLIIPRNKLNKLCNFFMKKILKYNNYEHNLSNFCHYIFKAFSRKAIKISNHD